MKIQKIEIEQFGGLKDFTLELNSGAQYIYGENEAGKSTLCAFLAAMFYGLAAKVRGGGLRGDSRSLYMPWGETYMAGTLYFEAEGTEYVLSRRFGQTARGDKTKLMTAVDWQEVSVSPDEIGQHFLGVGEEAFYKTLFISQLGAAFEKGKEDELMTRLSNLERTGDEDTSVQKALAELERTQHELVTKTGRGGLIVQLDSEIEALKTELLEAKQRNLSFRSLLSDIQQMTAEKEAADRKLSELDEQRKTAAAYLEYQKVQQAIKKAEEVSAHLEQERKRLDALQTEKQQLAAEKEALASVLSLEPDAVLHLAEKEAACTVLEKQLKQQAALLQEVNELTEQVAQKKQKKASVALVAMMLLFVLLTIFLGIFLSPFFFVLTAAFLLGLVFGIRRGKSKENLSLAAQLKEKQSALARMQEEATDQQLALLKEEIKVIFSKAQVDSLQALTEKLEAGKALSFKLEALEQEEKRLAESVKRLALELDALPETEAKEKVVYNGPPLAVLDEARQKLQRQQLERERELAQKNAKAENGFSGTRSVSMIESALEEAYERRRELCEQYEAISLARDVMAECAEDMKNTFAPVLNEKSGALIAELTGGKYQEIRVTDAYKIMLKTPAGNDIVPAEFVSAGTYDLLYFALRMAVLKTLYDEIPLLILDDAFMQLDDTRQKEAFSWLCDRHAGQVLYFSCHKPTDAWTETVITL